MMFFVNRPSIDANWRLFLVTGVFRGLHYLLEFEWETLTALRAERALSRFFISYCSSLAEEQLPRESQTSGLRVAILGVAAPLHVRFAR